MEWAIVGVEGSRGRFEEGGKKRREARERGSLLFERMGGGREKEEREDRLDEAIEEGVSDRVGA